MLNFLLIYSQKNKRISSKILSRFLDKKTNLILFKSNQAYYILSKNFKRFGLFYGDENFSKNLTYDSKENTYSFFDGIILHNEKYTDDIHDLIPNDEKYDHFWTAGNYCAGVFSEEGINFIHQSVLGTYGLFFAQEKDIFIISNNPHLIAHAIKKRKTPKTNYNAFIGWILEGIQYDLETTYKGVYSFPINAALTINSQNEILFQTITDNLYKSNTLFTFDQIYNNLLYTTKCIGNTMQKSWGSITGGIDSRTVLALIKKANLLDRFTFSISGLQEHPDVKVAKMISEKLHIPLTINDTKQVTLQPTQYISDMQKNMFYFCGNRGIQEMGNSVHTPTSKIVIPISGIYGEIIRSCVYKNYIFPDENQNSISNVRKILVSNSLLTQETQKNFFRKKIQILKHMPTKHEFSLAFELIRKPQFHGGITFRNQMHLMYNTSLAHISVLKDYHKRENDWFNFEIINRACPELLKIPFANNAWKEYNYIDRDDAEDFKKIIPVVEEKSNVQIAPVYLSIQKVNILHNYLLHPDKKIFKYIDKKQYWNFVKGNIKTKDAKIAYKLCDLLLPTFWTRSLEKQKICSKEEAPVPAPINQTTLLKQPSFFCEEDYGNTLFTISEVLNQNYLILLSRKSMFMKSYLSEKEIELFLKTSKSKTMGRIDIEINRSPIGECVSIYDKKTNTILSEPKWFKESNITGTSYQDDTGVGMLQISVLCDCEIRIHLRGKDLKKNNKRIPCWVKYTNLSINGINVLTKPVHSWHDKGYMYAIRAKKGEKIELNFEWEKSYVIERFYNHILTYFHKYI